MVISAHQPFVAKKCGDNMKKAFSLVLVLLLSFVFASYVVKAEEAQQDPDLVTVTVKSYFNSESIVTNSIENQTYGSKVSFDGNLNPESQTGYAFAYWIVNGVVRNDLPVDHTFVVTIDLELIGVYYPTEPVQYLVMFMDSNGHEIGWEYVASGGSATAPAELPSKPGYLVDDVTPWSQSFTNVTNHVVTILQYELDTSGTYALIVNGGTGDDATVAYNEVVTAVAGTPDEGEYFHHWEVEDRIVSYQSTYSFTMLQNTTITAVYSTTEPDDLPTVSLSHDLALRDGYESYLGQFYLPSGYELVEFGVLTSTSSDYLDLDTAGVIRNKGEKFNGTTKEFLISIQDANAVSRRGYMICKDGLGDLVTVYDAPAFYVANGGFETGDLSHWNAYMIWKDESGMASFDSRRVVNDTYFGGNYPYDRDGSYNLGLAEDTIGWDQVSERMGHLRSSNFTLGGSGWVSFKLGGGRNPSFAYVSVRKTTDNTEIARFGNRHYNDTGKATTQYGSSISNAEAFLFQYYFDLSSVGTIGESYYFTITEASSYEWTIISADSFVTYYKTAPTPTADETATNILPTINGAGSATNSIPNGNPYVSGLTSWDNSDGLFREDSAVAKSDQSGISGTGVLRSSAFNLDGNVHMQIEWAGALYLDKQIFISVKEVGTNIEVLRIIRRDNLPSKDNDNFDKHMIDLSELDATKEYYLEISDNKDGKYMWIKEVRLITEAAFNSVVGSYPGDEAAYITTIETEFIYNYN